MKTIEFKSIQDVIKFLTEYVIECTPEDNCGRCDDGRECVKFLSQFTPVTDEEILIYFNNYSNCRADMPVKIGDNPKIPAMTRSAVIEFAKWFRSRMSNNLREELIKYDKWLVNHYWGSNELPTKEKAVNGYLESRLK